MNDKSRIIIMDVNDPASIEKAEDRFTSVMRDSKSTRDDKVQAMIGLAELRLISFLTDNYVKKQVAPEDVASAIHGLAGLYSNIMDLVPPEHKRVMVSFFTQCVTRHDAFRDYHRSTNGDK